MAASALLNLIQTTSAQQLSVGEWRPRQHADWRTSFTNARDNRYGSSFAGLTALPAGRTAVAHGAMPAGGLQRLRAETKATQRVQPSRTESRRAATEHGARIEHSQLQAAERGITKQQATELRELHKALAEWLAEAEAAAGSDAALSAEWLAAGSELWQRVETLLAELTPHAQGYGQGITGQLGQALASNAGTTAYAAADNGAAKWFSKLSGAALQQVPAEQSEALGDFATKTLQLLQTFKHGESAFLLERVGLLQGQLQQLQETLQLTLQHNGMAGNALSEAADWTQLVFAERAARTAEHGDSNPTHQQSFGGGGTNTSSALSGQGTEAQLSGNGGHSSNGNNRHGAAAANRYHFSLQQAASVGGNAGGTSAAMNFTQTLAQAMPPPRALAGGTGGHNGHLAILGARDMPATQTRLSAEFAPFTSRLQAGQLLDKLVKGMQKAVVGGRELFKVTLRPPELGEVVVHMQKAEGQLSVKLVVENTTVKTLVEDHLELLKTQLAQQDVYVTELDVVVEERPQAQEQHLAQQQARNFWQQVQHHGAAAAEAEVTLEAGVQLNGALSVGAELLTVTI